MEENYIKDTKPTIMKPGDGYPVGVVAEQLGKWYGNTHKIYYNLPLKEVVRIGLVSIKTKKERQDNEPEVDMINGFIPLNADEFITLVETDFDVITIRKTRNGTEELVTSLTSSNANAILKSFDQFRMNLPPIMSIFNVQMPLIKNGQLMLSKRGYDPELYAWTPEDSPDVRTDMTIDDAKKIYDAIFGDFCFVSKQDKINAIALALTPYVRELYSRRSIRTPLGFYLANRERAGKDYCAGITGIIYEGSPIEDMPICSDSETHDEEFRKKVLSTLMIGRNRIHMSNNKGYINSAVLEATITNEHINDRQLGGNKMLTFDNTLDITASANVGITYSADLARRAVFVNFFFKEEDPNERIFKIPDLHGYIMENRGEILSANYALVRNWYEKGMQPCSKPFASFPEWMRVVGGIMEAAGYDVPTNNDTLNAIGGDRETADMKALFMACHEKWGEEYKPIAVLYSELEREDGILSGLFPYIDMTKPSGHAIFAKTVSKFAGRILGSIYEEKIEAKAARGNKYRWLDVNGNTYKDLIERGSKEQMSLNNLNKNGEAEESSAQDEAGKAGKAGISSPTHAGGRAHARTRMDFGGQFPAFPAYPASPAADCPPALHPSPDSSPPDTLTSDTLPPSTSLKTPLERTESNLNEQTRPPLPNIPPTLQTPPKTNPHAIQPTLSTSPPPPKLCRVCHTSTSTLVHDPRGEGGFICIDCLNEYQRKNEEE